jgi:hypothetical protein
VNPVEIAERLPGRSAADVQRYIADQSTDALPLDDAHARVVYRVDACSPPKPLPMHEVIMTVFVVLTGA